MALELKDVRLKLDPDTHELLRILAEAKNGGDIGDMARQIIERAVHGELHEVRLAAAKLARLGLAGRGRGSAGKTGEGGE